MVEWAAICTTIGSTEMTLKKISTNEVNHTEHLDRRVHKPRDIHRTERNLKNALRSNDVGRLAWLNDDDIEMDDNDKDS